VIAYTDSARARPAPRKVGRPFKMRFLEARHAGLWKTRSRLFVASCKLKKIDDVEWIDDDVIDLDKQPAVDFTLSWQFWKGQTVVRAAPSRQVSHLALDHPGRLSKLAVLGQERSGLGEERTGLGRQVEALQPATGALQQPPIATGQRSLELAEEPVSAPAR
jgi:hypothetical protein